MVNGELPHSVHDPCSYCATFHHHLKGEVTIALCCQLRSTHYTALQMKNSLKSNSVTILEITDDFHYIA